MKYTITLKSKNAKTGPIMVTTSASTTCPDACPLKDGPCYAKGGPLAAIWRGLDATDAGDTFQNGRGRVEVKSHADLIASIMLQAAKMWRHNQAGDLAGIGDTIDVEALNTIVEANKAAGANGFTYTHKPMTGSNLEAVRNANANGFTINLSANNLRHADELAALDAGPVATVLPIDQVTNTTTPAGRKVVVCPATIRDDVSCATCGLCQRQRDFIIGFPAHGVSKKKASAIASE